MISTINFERGGEHLELGVYSKIFMVVWDKLYKLDIINKYKIKFPEGRIFEDNFFTYSYLLHCKNIYWINKKSCKKKKKKLMV